MDRNNKKVSSRAFADRFRHIPQMQLWRYENRKNCLEQKTLRYGLVCEKINYNPLYQ